VKPSSAVSVEQIHIAGQAGAIEPGHEGATRSLRRVMNPSRSVPRKHPRPYLEHMSSKLRCIRKCGAISLDYLSRIYGGNSEKVRDVRKEDHQQKQSLAALRVKTVK
jgi:hypothetical protein